MINISFTGHRPNNVNMGGYNWLSIKNRAIMLSIQDNVLNIIKHSKDNDFKFIFGGAIGTDQMAFAVVNSIKYNPFIKVKPNIYLEIAVPFYNQFAKWEEKDVRRWQRQCILADEVTLVDTLDKYKIPNYQEDVYYPAKMQKRNEYMVNNSDLIIAVWDGKLSGGTYNCIKYARSLEKKIIVINPAVIK